MCLIVNNPTGEALHPLRMGVALENNPHGIGVMWHDRETGRVHALRGMFNHKDYTDLHNMLLGVPHAIHFRLRTRGPIGENACHPFKILSEEENGMDLYMMHNGTLDVPYVDGESDTMTFARRLSEQLASWENPYDFFREPILNKIQTLIGYNRLVFYGSGGLSVILNAKQGWFDHPENGRTTIDTFDGTSTPTWYANEYSFSGLNPRSNFTSRYSFNKNESIFDHEKWLRARDI